MKTRMHCGNHLGFTLIQLLVVVLILGALAVVVIPRSGESSPPPKNDVCSANVIMMNVWIQTYFASEGSWPGELGVIVNSPDYYPDGPPVCPYPGTVDYVYNTKTNRIDHHSHESGIR